MADLNNVEPLAQSNLVHYTAEMVDDDPAVRLDALARRIAALEFEVATILAGSGVEKS